MLLNQSILLENTLSKNNSSAGYTLRTRGDKPIIPIYDQLNEVDNNYPKVSLFSRNKGLSYEDNYKSINRDMNTINSIDLIPSKMGNYVLS
jgi:Nucleoporin autopeptidase